MQAPLSVEQAKERLKAAAARGDFALAQAAALDYVRAVEREARGLPRPGVESLTRQAMAILEKARRRLCVARTRVALQLRAVTCRMHYTTQAAAATNTWRIEA